MNEKSRIVILDGHTINPGDITWGPLEALGECVVHGRTPPELIVECARGARVVLTSKCRLDAAVLESLPDLEYVSILATGYNNVDLVSAGRRGIPVSNVPAYATESVAQAVFSLLLELTSAVGAHDAAVRRGEWTNCSDFCFYSKTIVELNGLTLGVVGYGATGRAVARIAAAFGMRVIVHAQRIPQDLGPLPVRFVPLEELFAIADVISLNCPQTSENSGFVNAALLARMKPSAFLINTSRGGLINEADLARALHAGTIAGAGLDVVAHEPIASDNSLLFAPNCVITPHNAWASLAARKRLVGLAAVNVSSFLTGMPLHVVNRQYLPASF
jgi:glycerate dehydrogenase